MVSISDIIIFDRARLRAFHEARALQFSKYAFLHQWASAQLAERLNDVRRVYQNALFIGAQPFASNKIKNAFYMNFSEARARQQHGASITADEEFLPFRDGSLDLIVSNLTLHATNDLPGVLLQLKRALKPDGLLLAAMPGGETLRELRESLMEAELAQKGGASPRVFPFADKQQMGALMQRAGYALPVVDSEIVTVMYDNMFKLLRDLRGMGENNIITRRNRTYAGRDFFGQAAAHYANKFREVDGRVRASFEIIFLVGWAPHESQQKPLKPGSATIRLAEALETAEIQTGEKAAP